MVFGWVWVSVWVRGAVFLKIVFVFDLFSDSMITMLKEIVTDRIIWRLNFGLQIQIPAVLRVIFRLQKQIAEIRE